jgi:hypothetical protein
VGLFKEFSPNWYRTVGGPFLLFSAVQIFLPHLGVLLNFLNVNLERYKDRGFTSNMRKTSKVVQEEYEELYIGPEFPMEIRLGQLVSLICVGFSFSCGIPLLYPLMLIQLIVMYWVDKYMLLRFYQITPLLSKVLTRHALNLLLLAIILHFGFGFFFYSNPRIIQTVIF